MVVSDKALLIINVVLTIISGIGACKSIRYYKKSKNLTIYAQTHKALIEIDKMINKLPDALEASNANNRNRKGFNLDVSLCEIGKELMNSLSVIRSNIPQEYSADLRALENQKSFNLQQYLNSYISGDVLDKDNGIDSIYYNMCQTRLVEMQEFLKQKIASTEEELK